MNDPTPVTNKKSPVRRKKDVGTLINSGLRYYKYQKEDIERLKKDFPKAHLDQSTIARDALDFYLPILRARYEASEVERNRAVRLAKADRSYK